MTLVDRFVCRREGHKPAVRLFPTTTVKVHSYITKCLRCGQMIEIKP